MKLTVLNNILLILEQLTTFTSASDDTDTNANVTSV